MTSKVKVNTVETESGSTLTLGKSGDTVTLASGASQSGFGRTGTVDWQTGSIKTANFTAANGEGYFANTSSGTFTMSLPAGTAGNIVSVVDYTNTFQTNALTISPNGSQKIGGVNANFVANTEGQSLTFVYVDDTEGWKNVQDSTSNAVGNPFLTATGGTETTCGDFKIHTFTSPGTFTVTNLSTTSAENTVGYLVVGGGGGSGRNRGAGGGGGGYREGRNVPVDNFTASPLVADAPTNAVTVTAQSYPITVGGGGTAGSPTCNPGGNGSNSVFSTITGTGGGGGGGSGGSGGDGGSGGGTSDGNPDFGTGNTPPVSPAQGSNGGVSTTGSGGAGSGGGGGATAAGSNGSSPTGGNGGAGATSSINGTPTGRAGGGGGGLDSPGSGSAGSAQDGAGAGVKGGSSGTAGTANTGGGAGGGGQPNPTGSTGGSGIVIIRYKYQ